MNKIGFDNEKYLQMQSDKIRERIGQFGGKLYLEFGGKLFDDYHASRVTPPRSLSSSAPMISKRISAGATSALLTIWTCCG